MKSCLLITNNWVSSGYETTTQESASVVADSRVCYCLRENRVNVDRKVRAMKINVQLYSVVSGFFWRNYSHSPGVFIKKDDSTPIDQSDNNIGYLAFHHLPSEFMSLPLKHWSELLGCEYTPTS